MLECENPRLLRARTLRSAGQGGHGESGWRRAELAQADGGREAVSEEEWADLGEGDAMDNGGAAAIEGRARLDERAVAAIPVDPHAVEMGELDPDGRSERRLGVEGLVLDFTNHAVAEGGLVAECFPEGNHARKVVVGEVRGAVVAELAVGHLEVAAEEIVEDVAGFLAAGEDIGAVARVAAEFANAAVGTAETLSAVDLATSKNAENAEGDDDEGGNSDEFQSHDRMHQLSDLFNLRGSCVVLRRFARFPSLFVVLVDHFPKFNSVFLDFTSVSATFRHKNPCYTSIIAQIIQNVNAFYALGQSVSFAGRKTFAGERAIIPALLREGEDFDKLGCGVDGAMSIDARRLVKLPQAITE